MVTTTDKGTPEQFIRSLPWSIDVLWQGRSGVHQLDDDRRATITLSTSAGVTGMSTSDHWTGFDVKIVSKTSGPIVAKAFGFRDHLTERADTRSDHPNQKFEVIGYCGWKWYIAEPAHPEHFTQAVETWIDEWR